MTQCSTTFGPPSKATIFVYAMPLSASPGMVWRGGPKLGQDTDEILTKLLGYDEDRIAAFHEKEII